MEQGTRKLAKSLLAAAALTAAASSARAVTFTEPGDAGATPATAAAAGSVTGAPSGLTQINGTIAGTNGLDADLYSFTLSTAATISFTASSTAGIDTSLSLFSSSGAPLLANDDASGTNFQAGFATGTLPAGLYYLGVALSGNEPVNSSNQLLFTADQPTTGVRGPASGLNPATLATFNGGTFFAEGGAYSIGIAATPSPSPAPPPPSPLAPLSSASPSCAASAANRLPENPSAARGRARFPRGNESSVHGGFHSNFSSPLNYLNL